MAARLLLEAGIQAVECQWKNMVPDVTAPGCDDLPFWALGEIGDTYVQRGWYII